MLKKIVLIFTLFLVVSCASSISSFDSVEKKGSMLVQKAYSHALVPKKLPFIRYSADFFVPQSKPKDKNKPDWFFDDAEVRFLDYTLEEAMRDLIEKKGINIRYLERLKKRTRFSLVHKGTIGGLLDKIAFATKYSYKLDGDLLSWSQFQTKKFDISFIAGQTDFFFGSKEKNKSAKESSNSAIMTDTGFSSTDEYINFSTKQLSIWDDLKNSLTLLTSPEGALVMNQSSSTILVKDYPENVRSIETYLNHENTRLTQMITVDFQIIEFTSKKGDQRGINWRVIKKDLASGGVLGLKSAFDTLIQDELAPTILGYSQKTGKYTGSEVLINVLDQYGVVSNVKKRRILSLNNQVSKLIEGSEIAYLAQSGGTSTANVGSQDNLKAGILRTGDAIYMLPNAVNDQIIIQLSTKLTGLERIREVKSGGRSIETPETRFSDLFLKFAVKDGETLLISGSSQHRDVYNENSMGGLLLLGGELSGEKSRKETIILITPRIVR
jgi:type IVB pilus formation R64 PilN family outer membrane protein